MSKVKSVLGKDLMLFVGGKALALATSCKLSISAETIDTQSNVPVFGPKRTFSNCLERFK